MPTIKHERQYWAPYQLDRKIFLRYGCLAVPFNTSDMAKEIDWVLDNPEYEKLRKNAREKALREFEMVKVAGQYKKLYEEILAE